MRFDLHIHSCLSPCGSLEMAPSAIAQTARERGIEGIALSDHNSALNTPAFRENCRREGIASLYGLEVCSAEEVHLLTIFDTVEQALTMTEWVYDALIKRVNQPEVFGDQPVVNADDEIEEMEWRLLSTATKKSLNEIGEKTHALTGLFIASHVDRPAFSFFSQLGLLAGNEGFDAMELSRTACEAEWRPRAGTIPFIRSSDAHHLDDIGRVWSEAELEAFTVAELKRALSANAVRISQPITKF